MPDSVFGGESSPRHQVATHAHYTGSKIVTAGGEVYDNKGNPYYENQETIKDIPKVQEGVDSQRNGQNEGNRLTVDSIDYPRIQKGHLFKIRWTGQTPKQ